VYLVDLATNEFTAIPDDYGYERAVTLAYGGSDAHKDRRLLITTRQIPNASKVVEGGMVFAAHCL